MALVDDLKSDADILLSDLAPTTVNIEQLTLLPDGEGGSKKAWTLKHEDVDCRLRPVSATESVIWNKETVTVSHILYCKPLDLSEVDRVVLGSRSFNITFVEDVDELGVLYRLRLFERKGETPETGGAGYGESGYGG